MSQERKEAFYFPGPLEGLKQKKGKKRQGSEREKAASSKKHMLLEKKSSTKQAGLNGQLLFSSVEKALWEAVEEYISPEHCDIHTFADATPSLLRAIQKGEEAMAHACNIENHEGEAYVLPLSIRKIIYYWYQENRASLSLPFFSLSRANAPVPAAPSLPSSHPNPFMARRENALQQARQHMTFFRMYSYEEIARFPSQVEGQEKAITLQWISDLLHILYICFPTLNREDCLDVLATTLSAWKGANEKKQKFHSIMEQLISFKEDGEEESEFGEIYRFLYAYMRNHNYPCAFFNAQMVKLVVQELGHAQRNVEVDIQQPTSEQPLSVSA